MGEVFGEKGVRWAAASAFLGLAVPLGLLATHSQITCGATEQCLPSAGTCDSCRMCPTGDYLLDQENFAASWIIRKMEEFTPGMTAAPDMGCGVAMPPPQFGARPGYTEENKRCLIEFFQAVAASGRPCTVSTDGGADGGTAP